MQLENLADMYTSHACDLCFKSKTRCDRKLPICGCCKKKSKVCTYTKAVRRRRNFPNQMKFNLTSNLFLLQGRQVVQVLPEKSSIIDCNHPLVLQVLRGHYNNPLFHNLIKEYKVKLTKYDTTLIQQLQLLVQPKPKLSMKSKRSGTVEFTSLFQTSVQMYFQFQNPFQPLFVPGQFDFNSKSLLLKLTLIVSGLTCMGNQEELIMLLLENIFLILNKVWHLFSLDTLQAIVLLVLLDIKFVPLLKLQSTARFFTMRMAIGLGLHKNVGLKDTGSCLTVERYLVMNYLIHHNLLYCCGCKRDVISLDFKLLSRLDWYQLELNFSLETQLVIVMSDFKLNMLDTMTKLIRWVGKYDKDRNADYQQIHLLSILIKEQSLSDLKKLHFLNKGKLNSKRNQSELIEDLIKFVAVHYLALQLQIHVYLMGTKFENQFQFFIDLNRMLSLTQSFTSKFHSLTTDFAKLQAATFLTKFFFTKLDLKTKTHLESLNVGLLYRPYLYLLKLYWLQDELKLS